MFRFFRNQPLKAFLLNVQATFKRRMGLTHFPETIIENHYRLTDFRKLGGGECPAVCDIAGYRLQICCQNHQRARLFHIFTSCFTKPWACVLIDSEFSHAQVCISQLPMKCVKPRFCILAKFFIAPLYKVFAWRAAFHWNEKFSLLSNGLIGVANSRIDFCTLFLPVYPFLPLFSSSLGEYRPELFDGNPIGTCDGNYRSEPSAQCSKPFYKAFVFALIWGQKCSAPINESKAYEQNKNKKGNRIDQYGCILTIVFAQEFHTYRHNTARLQMGVCT